MLQNQYLGPYQLTILAIILTGATLYVAPIIQQDQNLNNAQKILQVERQLNKQIPKILQQSAKEHKAKLPYALIEYKSQLIELNHGIIHPRSVIRVMPGTSGFWEYNESKLQAFFYPQHPALSFLHECHLIYQLSAIEPGYRIEPHLAGC